MLTTTPQPMLAPNDLARYAKFHGWSRGAPYGEDSRIYVGGRGEMIVLPTNINAPDYEHLADQAVRALAGFADSDPRTVYDEIKQFDRDVIRIRAISCDTKFGSINLKDGKTLVDNTWNVLKAVAGDVKKSAGWTKQGTDWLLEGFRLEQTEVGSFALAVSTPPVPDTPEDQILRPPQRHVPERMAEALVITRQLADAREDRTVDQGAHHVLSADWCTRLADIFAPFEGVEFGFTWARTAPLQRTVTTTFNTDADLQIIRELAESLQRDAPIEEYHDITFPGYVEVLKNPKPENSQSTVTIKAKFDERDIAIRAVLTPDDYRLACNASPTKSNVVVSGSRLFKAGRSWVLEGAQLRAVIPSIGEDTMSNDQPRMALST